MRRIENSRATQGTPLYPDAAVYMFDNGASCRAMTLALDGGFSRLGGEGETICFQPLAGIDDGRS